MNYNGLIIFLIIKLFELIAFYLYDNPPFPFSIKKPINHCNAVIVVLPYHGLVRYFYMTVCMFLCYNSITRVRGVIFAVVQLNLIGLLWYMEFIPTSDQMFSKHTV